MPTPKDRAIDLAAMRMAEPCKLDFGVLAATVLIGLSAAAHYPAIETGADGGHPADLIAEGGQSISRPFDAERFRGQAGEHSHSAGGTASPLHRFVSNPRATPHRHSTLAIQAQASNPIEVDIPDASLRTLIAYTLGKDASQPIYRHEMAALTVLNAHQTMRDEQGELIDFGGFRNLEGLQYAVNLTSLDLSVTSWTGGRWMNRNTIEDIAPLAGLAQLTGLDLSHGPIRDISPLANMEDLEWLRLVNNEITDLSPLSGLTNLKRLGLDSNDWLRDLSPLANLQLTNLYISSNDIEDIAPLSTITTLQSLDVSFNGVSDISALASLVHLRFLGIGGLGITDLSLLDSIHDLKVLYALNNDIVDISALSRHRNLEVAWLGRNNITDISPLGGLARLRILYLSYNKIVDIAPLENIVNVQTLDLENNDIADISSLAKLPRLRSLDLRSNRVSDISPLVRNTGMGSGDDLDLRSNLLSKMAIDNDVPLLKSRGATVRYDEIIVRVGDPALTYGDNVFVLPISENLASDELQFGQYLERFYSSFKDEFDFLLFLSNLGWREDEKRDYLGAYFGRKNDVQGIGQPIQMSEQRLQGFIHFSYYYAMANGPTLHELMHRWANSMVSEYQPHWGLTSADGILGGFNINDLVDNGDGTYYFTNSFGGGGEALNSKPFSPIELYLAGFIGADDVPDLVELKGVRILYDEEGKVRRTEDGFRLIEVDELVTHTIEDLAAEHGWRVPHHTVAQRDFRAAAILLVDARRPATKERLDTISANVAWFSNAAEDDASGFNFYEATGGRGTMKMDDLSAASLPPE